MARVPTVLSLVLLGGLLLLLLLLLGAPIEDVLSFRENPVSRIVLVAVGLSVLTLAGLSAVLYLEFGQHRATAQEVAELRAENAELRDLVLAALENNEAVAAATDGLERRLETALDEVTEAMAAERQRVRAQVRAYLDHGPTPRSSGPGEQDGDARPEAQAGDGTEGLEEEVLQP